MATSETPSAPALPTAHPPSCDEANTHRVIPNSVLSVYDLASRFEGLPAPKPAYAIPATYIRS